MEQLALLLLLGIFAFVVALVTIAGWFEDLESDIGSQSNPNSQVQLAPQVGVFHRIFNKAISGEPVSHGLYAVVAGTLFTTLWQGFHLTPIMAIAIACGLTTVFHMSFATTAHVGRITSQNAFGQPLFLDVVLTHLPLIASHGFIVTTAVITLSYVMYQTGLSQLGSYLGYPIPVPVMALILGIIAGSIGSSTGDEHYGCEREFQKIPFGEGVPLKHYGNIVVKAELGYRSNIDIVWFCAKFGGPVSGFCYGLIVLFDNFRLFLGNIYNMIAVNMVVGVVIILILAFTNRRFEVWARRKFGPYT